MKHCECIVQTVKLHECTIAFHVTNENVILYMYVFVRIIDLMYSIMIKGKKKE